MRILPTLGKIAFTLFAIALVVGVIAAFGTRLGVWDYHIGLFGIYPWSVYATVGAVAAGLTWATFALATRDGTGARYGATALAGGILLLAPPLYYLIVAPTLPPIHDISSDIVHPPQFVKLLSLREGAENPETYDGPQIVDFAGKRRTVSALQRRYYGDIHSIGVLVAPKRLFWRALRAANGMGWHIVDFNPDEGRIEATDTSFFFGFTDDIVIRIKPSGEGGRLDIRSKSREGTTDVGENAARIRSYVKLLANS